MSQLLSALSAKHRRNLQLHQINCRLENEMYVQNHPELKTLISHFMFSAFKAEPEDMMSYAVEYFCQAGLKQVVEEANRSYTYKRKKGQRRIP